MSCHVTRALSLCPVLRIPRFSVVSWLRFPTRVWLGLLLAANAASGAPTPPVPAGSRPAAMNVSERAAQADAAVRRLALAPGLKGTLWAAEPLAMNPMAISFDPSGRLYVAETFRLGTSAREIRDYPGLRERDLAGRTPEDMQHLLRDLLGDRVIALATESERVRVIEDTDGDGTADRSQVFAEGFNQPFDGVTGGILAERDQVWLTASPSLWKLTSSSAPHQPAVRRETLRGFGVHVGSPGHGANGIVRGPDGMLYFAAGDRGAHLKGRDALPVSLTESGAILRCLPDGSRLEVVADGLRNPRALAFDDWGNLFTVDSASSGGDRARLVYVVDGSDHGWRVGFEEYPIMAGQPGAAFSLGRPQGKDQPAHFLPPVEAIADEPSSLVCYPGSGLGTEYRGTFFVGHFAANPEDSGILAYQLEPKGAGFGLAKSQLFLGGVLPTAVTFGPDSRLYVADWVSRWPWPKSGRGRVYAVDAANISASELATRNQTRRWIEGGMAGRPAGEVAELLGHADQRIRLAAQFELAERGESSLVVFEKIATNPGAPRSSRVHSLWGAGQLADRVPGALNHLPALLRDGDAEVRAQSAKLIGEHARFEFYRFLTAALQDPEPRVTFFAVQSLGKLQRKEAIPLLIELLRRHDGHDPVLRHALVIALARLGPDPALERTIKDPSRAVRLGGLLAYRRIGDPAVAAFLEDFVPTIVREAAFAINDVPIEAGTAALAAILEQVPLDDAPVILRAINAHFRLGKVENAQALATFASRAYVPAPLRAEALNRLGQWATPNSRDRITGLHRPIEPREPAPARQALRGFLAELSGKAPEDVQVATINAVAALAMPGMGHALWDVVFQAAHPVAARISALQALEQLRDLRLEVATQHAARSEHADLRAAALPILVRLPPAVGLPALKRMASHGTADDQRAIFPILSKIPGPQVDEILLMSLHRLRDGELPLATEAELIDAVRARTDPKLTELRDQISAAWRTSADGLLPYRSALQGGDPFKGRLIFERHPVLECLRCHEPGGSPADRESLRRKMVIKGSAEDVLDALVNPNARMNPGLERTQLTLRSHRVENGVVSQEDESVIKLRRTDGSETETSKDQVSQRRTLRCRMPGGVGEVLSRTELRDLLSYVADREQPLRLSSDGAELDRVPAIQTRRAGPPRK